MLNRNRTLATVVLALLGGPAAPGHAGDEAPTHHLAFRQLNELLPTPNGQRTASGAPGPDYWQQQADYVIHVTLDAVKHRITGRETITYHNKSPHELTYLWLQLGQNRFRRESIGALSRTEEDLHDGRSSEWARGLQARREFEAGVAIGSVKDAAGLKLSHTVVDTMMRVDLPQPLAPGKTLAFSIEWGHNIVDAKRMGARGGYELFKENATVIYGITQWFPRMCAYTDNEGWQNNQFIGNGEFTLEFGNYEVHITVPDTFVVGATGELQNPKTVLTPVQQARLLQASNAKAPVQVITPTEALKNEKRKATGTRVWTYKASKVRDFAFAASQKFIWDAMGVKINGVAKPVMAMSLYSNEAEKLWSRYATHSIAHTLEVYSRHVLPYPYPVAIAVDGPVGGGMEYPMICFNEGRPEKDGTYSEETKEELIGVIIHEVGHNWFPMIINSDERQWTWMDEGLNTFIEFLAETTWHKDFKAWAGEPNEITEYMRSKNQVPIMTNSELVLQFGENAYRKPATALNILRESILGRERFDFAFREYARRWAFKRPQPADFFRTMEDASGTDLDWFWRGWFFSNDHVDVSIEGLDHFTLKTGEPERDKGHDKKKRDAEPKSLTKQANAKHAFRVNQFPALADFYDTFDKLDVTPEDKKAYKELLEGLKEKDRKALELPWMFFVARFKNVGGLVTPIPLRITYQSGRAEEVTLPAEIWRRNGDVVARLLVTTEAIVRIEVDPHRETADTDLSNNVFPAKIVERTFQLKPEEKNENPMQIDKRRERRKRETAEIGTLAKALLDAWKKSGPKAPPAELASDLLKRVAKDVRTDRWRTAFHIVFSRAALDAGEAKNVRFADIHSNGPDKKAETGDDLHLVVYRDGRVELKE